jgi:hypothetical protein
MSTGPLTSRSAVRGALELVCSCLPVRLEILAALGRPADHGIRWARKRTFHAASCTMIGKMRALAILALRRPVRWLGAAICSARLAAAPH